MTAVPLKGRRSDLREIPVGQITVDMETQSRDHINPDVAHKYGGLMSSGEWDFDLSSAPIVLFFDGWQYWIGDGFHRVIGARGHKIESLMCEVRNGTARDALWHSFSANATHGYARLPSDVQHILRRIFGDPEWAKTPQREIARHTGIPETTVRRHHAKHDLSAPVAQMKPSKREVTRAGGKTYEMETRNIGKPAAPDPEPAAGQEWRQTDIEEFTRAPVQGCNPAHVPRAAHTSYLLMELSAHTTLTPAEFLAATAWSPEEELRPALRSVLPWLHELEVLLHAVPS